MPRAKKKKVAPQEQARVDDDPPESPRSPLCAPDPTPEPAPLPVPPVSPGRKHRIALASAAKRANRHLRVMNYHLDEASEQTILDERVHDAKTRKVEREMARLAKNDHIGRLKCDIKQFSIDLKFAYENSEFEGAYRRFFEAKIAALEARTLVREARIAQLLRRVRVLNRKRLCTAGRRRL
jgi:hypothetical protein